MQLVAATKLHQACRYGDVNGIVRVLQAYPALAWKRLTVAVGVADHHQRRHQPPHPYHELLPLSFMLIAAATATLDQVTLVCEIMLSMMKDDDTDNSSTEELLQIMKEERHPPLYWACKNPATQPGVIELLLEKFPTTPIPTTTTTTISSGSSPTTSATTIPLEWILCHHHPPSLDLIQTLVGIGCCVVQQRSIKVAFQCSLEDDILRYLIDTWKKVKGDKSFLLGSNSGGILRRERPLTLNVAQVQKVAEFLFPYITSLEVFAGCLDGQESFSLLLSSLANSTTSNIRQLQLMVQPQSIRLYGLAHVQECLYSLIGSNNNKIESLVLFGPQLGLASDRLLEALRFNTTLKSIIFREGRIYFSTTTTRTLAEEELETMLLQHNYTLQKLKFDDWNYRRANIGHLLLLNAFGRQEIRTCPPTKRLVEMLLHVTTTAAPARRLSILYGLLHESPWCWSQHNNE